MEDSSRCSGMGRKTRGVGIGGRFLLTSTLLLSIRPNSYSRPGRCIAVPTDTRVARTTKAKALAGQHTHTVTRPRGKTYSERDGECEEWLVYMYKVVGRLLCERIYSTHQFSFPPSSQRPAKLGRVRTANIILEGYNTNFYCA